MKRLSFGATVLVMIAYFLLFVCVATSITMLLNWPRSIEWVLTLFFGFGLLEIISRFGPEPHDSVMQRINRLPLQDRNIFLSSFTVGIFIAIYLGYSLTLSENYKFWVTMVIWLIITLTPIGLLGTQAGKSILFENKGKNAKFDK